jgi:hypothetical protein
VNDGSDHSDPGLQAPSCGDSSRPAVRPEGVRPLPGLVLSIVWSFIDLLIFALLALRGGDAAAPLPLPCEAAAAVGGLEGLDVGSPRTRSESVSTNCGRMRSNAASASATFSAEAAASHAAAAWRPSSPITTTAHVRTCGWGWGAEEEEEEEAPSRGAISPLSAAGSSASCDSV